MTPEQMRDKFLEAAAWVVRYWLAEDRMPTALEKMNGVVFSLLVMLDGESGQVPPMAVVPQSDEDGWTREDIAGSLHEHWHKFQPKAGNSGVDSVHT